MKTGENTGHSTEGNDCVSPGPPQPDTPEGDDRMLSPDHRIEDSKNRTGRKQRSFNIITTAACWFHRGRAGGFRGGQTGFGAYAIPKH